MGKGTFKIICAPFFRRVWQARNSKVSPSMEHCPEREDSQVTGSVIIYRPYAIPNVKRIVNGIPDTTPPF